MSQLRVLKNPFRKIRNAIRAAQICDEQTGFLNRAALKQELCSALQRPQPQDFAVLVIGVERYEQVRAMIGYEAMTTVVRQLGSIASNQENIQHVARIAPDSIAVFFKGNSDEAQQAIASIRKDLKHLNKTKNSGVSIETRFGFAVGNQDADQLIQNAELALGRARIQRQKVYQFSKTDFGSPEKKLGLMADLREGLRSNLFTLHYQPQICVRSGQVKSIEALFRWNGPGEFPVSIAELIQFAEDTGDIRHITRWTIRKARQDVVALAASGHDVKISLNISGHLICDQEFMSEFIRTTGDHISQFVLEITETAMLQNPDIALTNLKRLTELGVSIAMDDYGTGYSSLSQIQNLPICELKIDQRFIKNMTATNRDPLIVRSTIDLAHALEMYVVAEGVEDAATYALLKAMGCDVLQGYFIARPMPLARLAAFLEDSDAISAKNDGPLLNVLSHKV